MPPPWPPVLFGDLAAKHSDPGVQIGFDTAIAIACDVAAKQIQLRFPAYIDTVLGRAADFAGGAAVGKIEGAVLANRYQVNALAAALVKPLAV